MPEERDETPQPAPKEDRKRDRGNGNGNGYDRLPRSAVEGASWFARFFSGLTDERASRMMAFLLTLLVASVMVMLIWRVVSVKDESVPALLRSHEAQVIQITTTFEKSLDKISTVTDDKFNKFMSVMNEERRQDRAELREMNKTMTLMLSELVEWRRVFKKNVESPEVFGPLPFPVVPRLGVSGDPDLRPPEIAPMPRGVTGT